MVMDKVISREEAEVELRAHTYGYRYVHLLDFSGKDEMQITLDHAIKLANVYEKSKYDG